MSTHTQVTLFSSDEARIEYARRVTVAMLSTFQSNPALIEDALMRGRIGLAQMSDKMLIETGTEVWGVPAPTNVAAAEDQQHRLH